MPLNTYRSRFSYKNHSLCDVISRHRNLVNYSFCRRFNWNRP